MKRKPLDLTVDGIILFFMGLFGMLAIVPFLYVVAASLTPLELMGTRGQIVLFPKRISFDAYRYVFSTRTLMQALRVSVMLTGVGTFFNILMTVLFAYPLAHTNIKGRRIILFLVTFTMMFSGGIIPSYMVVRSLGMMNRMSALILPGAISTFSFIVFRNYFMGLPKELEESAMIDGAGYLRILIQIIIPISMPIIATFAVIYGVGHWNSWFAATLYIRDSARWPIQVVLRMLTNLSMALGDTTMMDSDIMLPPVTARMCTIVIATVPILMVYPFLQKYFTKGILMGSVKG